MPQPITVWMVHLDAGRDLHEVKGTLSLEADGLRFVDRATNAEHRIPLEAVRRAKRNLGSPVLLLRWEHDGGTRETAFYFAKPPPLPSAQSDLATATIAGRGLFGGRQPSKRRQRRDSMTYMAAQARVTKGAIEAWVRAISSGTSRER